MQKRITVQCLWYSVTRDEPTCMICTHTDARIHTRCKTQRTVFHNTLFNISSKNGAFIAVFCNAALCNNAHVELSHKVLVSLDLVLHSHLNWNRHFLRKLKMMLGYCRWLPGHCYIFAKVSGTLQITIAEQFIEAKPKSHYGLVWLSYFKGCDLNKYTYCVFQWSTTLCSFTHE